jgi:putative hydrolase of the HAD superfamily
VLALHDATERANLELFGYGIKGFTLSMIETAIEVSRGEVSTSAIAELLRLGKEMLAHPVELLDGVADAVEALAEHHRLVLITKGDLIHQETKIARSGLADRFERIEIVSEKDPATYRAILDRMDVAPERFLMVGNSVRSDVLPVLELGGHAVHVPYEITWSHEVVDDHADDAFPVLESLGQLAGWLTPSGT